MRLRVFSSTLLGPLLVVVALACGSCAADVSSAPESEFSITGTVRDDLTNEPLDGAEVIFVSDVLDMTDARSDGHGQFQMTVSVRDMVRFGTLHAKREGYQDSASHTVYFDGTARTVELRMRAKSE